jgi:hypothetical protein
MMFGVPTLRQFTYSGGSNNPNRGRGGDFITAVCKLPLAISDCFHSQIGKLTSEEAAFSSIQLGLLANVKLQPRHENQLSESYHSTAT